MNSESVYKSPQLQYDKQGYVRSFDIDTCNKEDLQEFYHTYGFLIFDNIITPMQTQMTIDALWSATIQYVETLVKKQIKRDDPKTWGYIRGFHKAFGFVGDGVLEQMQFWENRKNHKVYKSFKLAYEANTKKQLKQPLIASFDRGSMILPAGINPQWETQDIYHFDIDPWSWVNIYQGPYRKYDYNPHATQMLLGEGNYQKNVGYTKFAGVLALSDTNQNSGGFQCACGFQNYIKKWCVDNPKRIHITDDQNLVNNFKKIFMRKGSLLVFSRQLPHNIYKNTSKNFRYAQYLRMSPLSSLILDQQLIMARKQLIKMLLPKNLDVSDPISREIFMLDEVPKVIAINEDKNDKKDTQNSKQAEPKKQKCSLF